MCKSTVNLLRALASLKLTLAGIVVLLVSVLLAYFDKGHSSLIIMPALGLLALNLLAAIIVNPRIRQNSGLLMFHICLLMIAALTILSQLTSMKGRVEILQGVAFDASAVTATELGPLHSLKRLQQVDFVQGDIEVEYAADLRRGPTRSSVLVNNGATIVGDNTAFRSHGYRFYTTSNKGFAAVVNWYAKDGRVERGAIHFPSYPLYDWKQQNQWRTPSGEQIGFRLMIDTRLDTEQSWRLQGTEHGRLEIALPDKTQRTLEPGDVIELKGGVLEFEAIRMWMGYKIFYNPLLAWFFAAALVGVAGIAWHYYLKLSSPVKTRSLAGHKAGRGGAVSTTHS